MTWYWLKPTNATTKNFIILLYNQVTLIFEYFKYLFLTNDLTFILEQYERTPKSLDQETLPKQATLIHSLLQSGLHPQLPRY